jgi:L-ascorbate metabolism protein UlaG (beta-lactamase superfamily)
VKLLRPLLLTLLLLLVAGAALLTYGLKVYTEPAVDPRWQLSGGDSAADGAVTVRFSGTATLLFSDGETRWMVDGWFSRPGPLRLLFGKIEPDLEAIERGLKANQVEQLAAVIPVHSHYDHAMDAPEVARRTGALLLGSESTANIGRGWGLPESQIQVLQDREPVSLGKFEITAIESRHFQFPDPAFRERALGNPVIAEPLVPPVGAFDYRLGKAYVLHVRHPAGSWLIVGSAGFVEGALEGVHADVVFLGVGGLGTQSAAYRESFWRESVARVEPTRLIPIHFDSLVAPVEGPFRGDPIAMDVIGGGSADTLSFLRQKERDNPDITFQTLPRFEAISLFD